MKHRTTKTILILSTVILIVTIFTYGYLFLIFRDLLSNISGLYDTDAQGKAKLEELSKVEQNLKDTLANKDRLTSLFVKQAEVADFIQILETMMKQTRLKGSVDSVTDESVGDSEMENKGKLVLSMTANGEWRDVIRFAGLVEKIPYKSTVDSISFSTLSQQPDLKNTTQMGIWMITLKMHVLMIKSKKISPETK